MLTWDDSMSTGLPQIDAQHKEIIEKYNELSAALTHGSGAGRVAAGELLDFLQFYSVWHFEREERCMEEYRCPAAELNKQAHAQFIEMFGSFYERWQESSMDPELVQTTYAELGRWIASHIMSVDTALLPCVKQDQAARTSAE
jgi:hemerythrin